MKAELIDSMGDDLRVVNAARVSFNKQSTWDNEEEWLEFDEDLRVSKKDKKLINYLASNGHWTPFAHPTITIRETVPIFVARQRFKHMVGFVYNEVSRRYVDDDPEYFTAFSWRVRAEDKKQGSGPELDYEVNEECHRQYAIACGACDAAYRNLLDMGVAPEQARMVLPQSMYTSYYVTGSLAAWARAYKLRSDPHAQTEIQELAKQWDTIIRPLFPVSWSALTDV